LHIGWGAPVCLVLEAVERARRARPHLTVLTGDYINHLHHLKELRRVVRRLPRPSLVTLGNHDHRTGASKIAAVFASEGISILKNETRTLKLNGNHLYVVGIDDNITRHHDLPKALAKLPPGKRAIVLSHAPSIAELVARHHKARHLILVGHTHAGQVYVPLLSRAIARLGGARYLAGFYTVKKNRMYVNAGIGNATIRRRVGHRARPEVAIFDLIPFVD
jgi:predicted MPP superfamily phosphohydrolase